MLQKDAVIVKNAITHYNYFNSDLAGRKPETSLTITYFTNHSY